MRKMTTPRPSTILPICKDKNTGEESQSYTMCFDENHDHLANPEWWITEDGYSFDVGDRVYNYYDGEWGTVESEPRDRDGWFDFKPEGKDWCKSLNSVRISKNKPGS